MAHDPHTAAGSHSHDAPDAHHGVGHIVSPKILITTAVGLLILTFITVKASEVNFTQVDLPELNIYVCMAIALVKAALVCLFFMHLRWDRPFNGFLLVGSLALVALFITFAMTDTSEYQNEVVKGNSATIQSKLDALPKAPAAGAPAAAAAH